MDKDDTRFRQLAPAVLRDLMTDFELTREQAAAIVGHLGNESAGFTVMQEVGQPAGSGGYGWGGWTGPRREAFLKHCEQNGLDWQSDEANYAYLKAELKGPERHIIRELKRAATLADATQVFLATYQRANVVAMNAVLGWANTALGSVEDGPLPTDAVGPLPGSGGTDPD